MPVSEINKNELTKKMSDNLLVLRNKLRLNQSELRKRWELAGKLFSK